MINHLDEKHVQDLFGSNKNFVYSIPKYQREYSWSYSHWEALINDIIDNDKKEYFLGTIICVPSDSSTFDDKTVIELIDGQQRMTTLSILLLSLYSKISPLSETFITDKEKYRKYLDLENELADGKGQLRIIPQSINYNKDDYDFVFCDYGLGKKVNKISFLKKRKIYKCLSFFQGAIDKYIQERLSEENDKIECDILFELLDKVNYAVLVTLTVSSLEDAYMMFESLNNRGLELSAIDLIKNKIIQIADKTNEADDAYAAWCRILDHFGAENDKEQDRFLRYYYNAFRGDLNKGVVIPKPAGGEYPFGYLATKSTVLSIYEKMINYDYKKLIADLEIKAALYALIIGQNTEYGEMIALKDPLLDLARIQGAPSYILILYLLSNKETLGLSYDDIAEIVRYLSKFFVRRNMTDYPSTRNLNKIFMDTIAEASSMHGFEIVSKIKASLKSHSSSDEDFEKRLRGNIYEENVDATRYILSKYEEIYKTKETPDVWARDDKDGKYIFTIEHIFPEGKNIPKEWIEMIADGDSDKAKSIFDKYVHTIGNLTLTGYNSNLSNLSFEKKKNRQDDSGNYIGYKNKLALNSAVVDKDKWTVKCIEDRANTLIGELKKAFEL